MDIVAARSAKGATVFHAGEAAEQMVSRVYQRAGALFLAHRWRGAGGEIDLIFRDGGAIIFIEVKKSKSLATAALRIGTVQKKRIFAAAQEFLAGEPDGLLSNVRFDVALVDSQGTVEILENALFEA